MWTESAIGLESRSVRRWAGRVLPSLVLRYLIVLTLVMAVMLMYPFAIIGIDPDAAVCDPSVICDDFGSDQLPQQPVHILDALF